MQYGFVIDQRRCIGCHACTVACKAEHEIPLGVFRTWVTYVEKGTFPDTRRLFQVNRCNHCANAPCVAICPTGALYRRPDGIVDFDNAKCIGCKACMEACPYDAIYIDPETHTAAKCNYCAHRIDQGLLPACVVVCPAQAIIAGDLEDPTSLAAQLIASEPSAVRKPEQGTRPNVYYIGADEATLRPTESLPRDGYLWSEAPDIPLLAVPRPAQATASRVYDPPKNRRPWGGLVSAYLWTKSLAAGSGLLTALGLLGFFRPNPEVRLLNPLLALAFLLVTAVLLIADLERPERFWRLLIRPNPRSWLVLGGYVLTAFGALTLICLAAVLFGRPFHNLPLGLLEGLAALFTASYSAFLFRQAEGRDFWQSPLPFWHLLVQAGLAASALAVAEGVFGGPPTLLRLGLVSLPILLLGHGAIALLELYQHHPTAEARLAARALASGPLAGRFWGAALGIGAALPLALTAFALLSHQAPLALLAVLSSLFGLIAYEHLWVVAGQVAPLS